MNVVPPDSLDSGRARAHRPDLGAQWFALHDAASVVAALAGLQPGEATAAVRLFPEALTAAGGWRAAHARQGIADLCAILETGLAALLTVNAGGASPAVPARALWEEFVAARNALLELAPIGSLDRRRLA